MRAFRVPGLVIVASRGSLGVATPGLLFTGHTVPLSPGAPSPRSQAHLKKSSLQYTLSPRLKQRSASGV